ncbi:substrate-binding periplasmic protein [Legionella londiniensis]|uniref:Bacterial extracellular solute-binding protein, family 3 n=1 Tax=Legionella londiniensis TaxID=45068 RepID=A0A0W0VSH5_9GAMM|nr:ABC transporter substrate-binding protein [Legionella londiniensis]KTD23070.1 Bacterial extracellular solute-binding protein, family 3 [Legionella londiniensis]STX94087.1 Bacterial extracellular solute-binding proteins, family 3 [Legionella londiniensis]
MEKFVGKLLILMCLLISGCDLPKDPNHTLDKVKKTHILRVGAIYNPPWVGKNESGIEPILLKQFAKELNAHPKFFYLPESLAMKALIEGQVDVVIGGITADTPWEKKIGLTRPYYKEIYYIGRPEKLSKKHLVAISPANWIQKYLNIDNYNIIETVSPFSTGFAVAAPRWELENHHYQLMTKLHKVNHVIVIPRGENQFLITLEKYLKNQEKQIKHHLSKVNHEASPSI